MFNRIFSRFKSSSFSARAKRFYSNLKPTRVSGTRVRNYTLFAATAIWYETFTDVVDKKGEPVPEGTFSNLDKFRNLFSIPRNPEVENSQEDPEGIPIFDELFSDFEGIPNEPKDPEDPETYEERPVPEAIPRFVYDQVMPLFYYDSYYHGLLSSPQAMLNYNLSQQVEESYHPWYPKDRKKLDLFLRSANTNLWKSYPRLIPERLPLPWGKPITIVIDCSIFYSKANTTRPAWRHFLHEVSQVYEIILYGESLRAVREIDSRSKWCSFLLCPQMNKGFDPELFKNPHCLNRPLDSVVFLDSTTQNSHIAPRNTLILKKWDGKYLNDPSLANTSALLRDIADAHKMGFPVYSVVDKFQSVQLDCSEMYLARQDPDRYVINNGIVQAIPA